MIEATSYNCLSQPAVSYHPRKAAADSRKAASSKEDSILAREAVSFKEGCQWAVVGWTVS
jgi:hypothetical protein